MIVALYVVHIVYTVWLISRGLPGHTLVSYHRPSYQGVVYMGAVTAFGIYYERGAFLVFEEQIIRFKVHISHGVILILEEQVN